MKRLIVISLIAASALMGYASSPPVASASRASSSASTYPITITAANGKVTIRSRPTRIMSLSATATEMLYADGAGSQVVAVDKYSTDPPNAPRTSLTGYETSAESYVRFHPDLVILAVDEHGLFNQLAILHIPVLFMPPAVDLNDSYSQFLQLGEATGHDTQAEREIATIRSQLNAVSRSVGSRAKGLTYYAEFDPTMYTATSKTFVGALFARLGMVNIADAAGRAGDQYPQLSAEYLVHANPDFVFLADDQCCGQSAKTFAARPDLSQLTAVRLHHVFLIPDPIAAQWGPLVVNFLRTVADDVTTATAKK